MSDLPEWMRHRIEVVTAEINTLLPDGLEARWELTEGCGEEDGDVILTRPPVAQDGTFWG